MIREIGERRTTDAEGRFRITIDEGAVRAGTSRIRILRRAGDGSAGLGARRDEIRVEEDVDLGDIVLHPLPILARGLVEDTSGRPIDAATVTLMVRDAPSSGNPCWTSVRGVRHEPTGGALGGKLIVSEGIPVTWLRVETVAFDQDLRAGGPSSRRTLIAIPRPGGSFFLDDLWPGRTVVRVGLRWDAEPLFELDDLLVAEDGRSDDTRLERIDLRDLLHLRRIEAIDEAGNPIRRGHVAFRPADGSAATT